MLFCGHRAVKPNKKSPTNLYFTWFVGLLVLFHLDNDYCI